jgi:serine/threonine-protein kinase RsbT
MVARVHVCSLSDVLTARQKGRDLARVLGFSATDQTMIVTAISELARNIVRYAGYGELQLSVQRNQSLSASW